MIAPPPPRRAARASNEIGSSTTTSHEVRPAPRRVSLACGAERTTRPAINSGRASFAAWVLPMTVLPRSTRSAGPGSWRGRCSWICWSCASSQSMCPSSSARICSSSRRLPLSPVRAAELDAPVEALHGVLLHRQVELVLLRDVRADVDLHVLLHVGHAVQVEDAVDDQLRVLHLPDRLFLRVLGQLLVLPVLQHARRG